MKKNQEDYHNRNNPTLDCSDDKEKVNILFFILINLGTDTIAVYGTIMEMHKVLRS